MAWTGIKIEGDTINDGGRKLKLGTFPYRITGASLAVVKADVTGKTQQVVIDLVHGRDYFCRVYFSVMSENDKQREIAEKGLRAFAQAAGLKGILKPDSLKKLVENWVLVEAKETPNKKGGDPYINIATVEAYHPEEEEEENEKEAPPAEAVKPAKKSKPAPVPFVEIEEEDEDEEDEDEEGETPKPAAGAKKRPW